MAPVRVRGCARLGPLGKTRGQHPAGLADASRRLNGPRKATSRRPITVRLRSKSCPASGHRVCWAGRRVVVATEMPPTPQQADVGTKTRSAGRVPLEQSPDAIIGSKGDRNGHHLQGRRTNIPERFREHAVGKLVKSKNWIRRRSGSTWRSARSVTRGKRARQRVELTIQSRGPVIRAEAAADDRYTALDLAYAKLEARCAGRVTGGRRGTLTGNSPASVARLLICPGAGHHRAGSDRSGPADPGRSGQANGNGHGLLPAGR